MMSSVLSFNKKTESELHYAILKTEMALLALISTESSETWTPNGYSPSLFVLPIL